MLYAVDVIADNFCAPLICFIDETKVGNPLLAALNKASELFVKYYNVENPQFFTYNETGGTLYSTWKNEHSFSSMAIAELKNPRPFDITE